MSEIQNVPAADVPDDARILDVREDYEWEAGHIDGAVHIPLDQLPERVDELDPDHDLHVICRSGGRSERTVQWLVQQGFDVVNVDGGMQAWSRAGKSMAGGRDGQDPVVA